MTEANCLLALRSLSRKLSARAGIPQPAFRRFVEKALAVILISGVCALPASGYAQRLPTPAQFFGFTPGEEGKLASLEQLLAYYRELDRLSPRVILKELGKTTEGNPFVLVLISSERNLNRLAEIRGIQKLLADPRGLTQTAADSLIRLVPAIVSVNCSIHATEVGAAQMAPGLVHDLVTGEIEGARMVLDSTLVLLIPVHNPDGLVIVKNWYDSTLGTDYEGAPLPRLYHKYTGHDNNRDWFMFTQVETRLTVDSVYNVWHPQIVLDMHQMGSSGARLFVPPYVDPIDPNVDPLLVAEMNDLGTFVQARCLEQGLAGVVTGSRYDAFTPARAYPNYHGGIRFLTEVASCRIASSVEIAGEELRGDLDFSPRTRSSNFPFPWDGGQWTLRDVITYHRAAAHAVLYHAALNRTRWVRNAFRVLKRQCEWKGKPAGFLIPERQWDPSAADELVKVLRRGNVEVYRIEDGLVVPLAQPYGAFAKTLLEVTRYTVPRVGDQTRRPYDVTTHSLPLLFGVRVKPLDALPNPLGEQVDRFPSRRTEAGRHDAEAVVLDCRANGAFRVLNAARGQASVFRLLRSWRSGQRFFPPGSFVLEGDVGHLKDLAELADELRVPYALVSVDPLGPRRALLSARVGLYQSWVPSIDEGWTRWILEDYGFRFAVLHDADIRSGALDTLDVLIVPQLRPKQIAEGWSEEKMPPKYAGGLGPMGIDAVRNFVNSGGTLILFGSAVRFADEYLGVDLCEDPDQTVGEYYVPGALLRGEVLDSSGILVGLPSEVPLLCTTPPLLTQGAGRVLVRFAQDELLVSGWGVGLEQLRGRPALVEVRLGSGRILAFAFRPQFRAWTRLTFKLLFNALFHEM